MKQASLVPSFGHNTWREAGLGTVPGTCSTSGLETTTSKNTLPVGRFGRWRRLSKDYEKLPEVSEAMVTLAAICLMVHRLAWLPIESVCPSLPFKMAWLSKWAVRPRRTGRAAGPPREPEQVYEWLCRGCKAPDAGPSHHRVPAGPLACWSTPLAGY